MLARIYNMLVMQWQLPCAETKLAISLATPGAQSSQTELSAPTPVCYSWPQLYVPVPALTATRQSCALNISNAVLLTVDIGRDRLKSRHGCEIQHSLKPEKAPACHKQWCVCFHANI